VFKYLRDSVSWRVIGLSLLLIIGSFACGIFFFLVQRNVIILDAPFGKKSVAQERARVLQEKTVIRKKIRYYFFKDERLEHEDVMLMWHKGNIAANLKHLTNNWITFLQDESLIKNGVCLESVALSAFNEQAYLSFNQSFLARSRSVFQKWALVESLFKTIRCAEIPIRSIAILVENNYMRDDHLDFSYPWPIDGFEV